MLWCWKWPTPVTTFSLYSFSHKLSTNQRIPVVLVKSVILPFLWTRIKKQFLCLGLHLLYLRARHWETTFKATVWFILHLNIIIVVYVEFLLGRICGGNMQGMTENLLLGRHMCSGMLLNLIELFWIYSLRRKPLLHWIGKKLLYTSFLTISCGVTKWNSLFFSGSFLHFTAIEITFVI